MALKLSIFTTCTNPHVRGDMFEAALNCYTELADEVIIVNGGEGLGNLEIKQNGKVHKIIESPWPKEFNWPLIGQQFQKGYEAATGDWVIHMDLDMIFHERDFGAIRQAMEDHPTAPGLSFWKYQFILPDRYNLKSRIVLAVNKARYDNMIKYNSGGDLCQPSFDGEQMTPDHVFEARVPIYNYEKMTKTADQIMDDCGRMDRAYNRHFKDWQLSTDGSGSDESCFDGYIKLLRGRFAKEQKHIKFIEHPKFVKEDILDLKPNQFGFNGFGLLGDNDYVKEGINA